MADAYTRAIDKVTFRDFLDAISPTPVVGDAVSGLLGLYDTGKGLFGDYKAAQEKDPRKMIRGMAGNVDNYTSGLLNAASVVPLVSPAIAGMFIGKNSKVWDALKADEAQKMLAKGVDPKEVWKKTGTFKGVDGALRQEIDDSAAKFSAAATKPDDRFMEIGIGNLGDAMNHPRLSEAYPTLNSMTLELNPNIRQQGTYSDGILQVKRSSEPIRKSDLNTWRNSLLNAPESEMIDDAKYLVETEGLSFDDALRITKETRDEEVARVTKDLSNADFTNSERSTTLHELQHAIQEREGWARGGSPESMGEYAVTPEIEAARKIVDLSKQFKPDRVEKIIGEWNDPELVAKAKRLVDVMGKDGVVRAYDNAVASGSVDAYKRLAGEAEARLTQSRMNMTMPERLQVYPYDMLDVPQDQLIVRGLLGR